MAKGPDEKVMEKNVRGKLVRTAYLILIAICLIFVGAAAVGTFVDCVRDFAQDNRIIAYSVFGVLIAIVLILALILNLVRALRHNRTRSVIVISVEVVLLAVGLFSLSAILDTGFVLAVAAAPIAFMLIVIILSCWLDVAYHAIYILSFILVMIIMLGVFAHLYVGDVIKLHTLVAVPIATFIICLFMAASTVWSLRKVSDLNLADDDYIQEMVFIWIGKRLRCTREDCCTCTKTPPDENA